MPSFLLPDHAGHLVSLEDLLEKGPVALTLHRGHWCPYCRINISALAQAHQDVAKTGGQVVAILPDLQQFAEEFQVAKSAFDRTRSNLLRSNRSPVAETHREKCRACGQRPSV